MLTEPIIDIIVYGYPSYFPISLKENVYATTDYNGHIHYYLKDESTKAITLLESNMNVGLPIHCETNVLHKTEIQATNLLSGSFESYISLLDTRDYFDWIKDADEKWLDNPNVTVNEYIRGAGSLFNMYLYGKSETYIKPVLSINAKVGILFDWTVDENETWADNPNVTNQNYLQILIG